MEEGLKGTTFAFFASSLTAQASLSVLSSRYCLVISEKVLLVTLATTSKTGRSNGRIVFYCINSPAAMPFLFTLGGGNSSGDSGSSREISISLSIGPWYRRFIMIEYRGGVCNKAKTCD